MKTKAGDLDGVSNLGKILGKSVLLVAFLLGFLFSLSIQAAPPWLKTPAPVIYLADNLDEKDRLGWCIDTVGRGFSDRLHAHSCKPRGGDVQFRYNESKRKIESVTYSGKCATLSSSAAVGVSLGLMDCSTASSGQLFNYHADTLEFRPGENTSLCLAVGASSRSAGPFMSRDLQLVSCASTDPKFKQWTIKQH